MKENTYFLDECFFGVYLYKQKKISYPILQKILMLQKKLNKSIGTLALELKILNKEQIEEIYNQQRIDNNYFGEIAIKKGILTSDLVEHLLILQKKSFVSILEIIGLLGYIPGLELKEEFEKYNEQEIKNKSIIENKIKEYNADYKNLDIIMDVIKKIIYRLTLQIAKLDIDIEPIKELKKNDNIFKIQFSGDLDFEIYFDFDRDFATDLILSYFNKYPKKKVLTMKFPIISEFSNIVSGLISKELFNKLNLNINISVPVQVNENIIFEKTGLKIPVKLPLSNLNIIYKS